MTGLEPTWTEFLDVKSLHVLKNVIHVLLLSAGFNKLSFTCHMYFLVSLKVKFIFNTV